MTNSKPELHLFLIWLNARNCQDRIIADIKNTFDIVHIFEIIWSDSCYASNLTRFYGQRLPDRSFKEHHCGKGPFVVIVIRDKNPCYAQRSTSHGPCRVNVNTFDKKQLYREWTGGGHRIHATDTEDETNHDLTLLTGLNLSDFTRAYTTPFDGAIDPLKTDLPGANGWESIEKLFYVLNNTIPYLVLRNFEGLPHKYTLKTHGDIDLLADSAVALRYITNASPVFPNTPRILHYTMVNGSKILFDFRSVGDRYYCDAWEKSMLRNRILDRNGFYRPAETDYFFSLVYHALIHKPSIAEDYKIRLSALAQKEHLKLSPEDFNKREYCIGILNDFLSKNGYTITEPVDTSVYFNTQNIPIQKVSLARLIASSKTIGTAVAKILGQADDRSSNSKELHALDMLNSRVLRYHFSRERAFPLTVIECNNTIHAVEFGAQTGVVTRFLGERCASVYAIETQSDLANAARQRCADLKNVEIAAAPADDETMRAHFDLAVMLIDWSPLGAEHHAKITLRKWLETASVLLKENGTLLFGVDNADSIIASLLEQPKTGLTKTEIEQLLRHVGLKEYRFYYVFPNHIFPENIFTETSLQRNDPSMGCWAASTLFTDPKGNKIASPLLADLFIGLSKKNDLGNKAPSFIIQAGKQLHQKPSWQVKKFAGYPRRIETQTETEVVLIDNATIVNKSGPVIEDTLFLFDPNFSVPFYIGDTIEKKLHSCIAAGNQSGFIALLKEYSDYIITTFPSTTPAPRCAGENDCYVSGDALDCNLRNIISTPSGWRYFDLEWKCKLPLPLSLILYRSLLLLLQGSVLHNVFAMLQVRLHGSLFDCILYLLNQLNLFTLSDRRFIIYYNDFEDRFYSFAFNRQREKPAFLELFLSLYHHKETMPHSEQKKLYDSLLQEFPTAPELKQIQKEFPHLIDTQS